VDNAQQQGEQPWCSADLDCGYY